MTKNLKHRERSTTIPFRKYIQVGGSVGHLVTDDDIVSTSIEIWSSSLENAYGVTNHMEDN